MKKIICCVLMVLTCATMAFGVSGCKSAKEDAMVVEMITKFANDTNISLSKIDLLSGADTYGPSDDQKDYYAAWLYLDCGAENVAINAKYYLDTGKIEWKIISAPGQKFFETGKSINFKKVNKQLDA